MQEPVEQCRRERAIVVEDFGPVLGVVLNNSDGTFSINVTARDAFAEKRITYRGESSSCTNGSNLDNSDGTAHASCG